MHYLWEVLLAEVRNQRQRWYLALFSNNASDVLRRHERSHRAQTDASSRRGDDSVMLPDLPSGSATHVSPQASAAADIPSLFNTAGFEPDTGFTQGDASRTTANLGSGTWFLEDDFDVNALDFSITSMISEWAQIPNAPNLATGEQEAEAFAVPEVEAPSIAENAVKRKWFTHISISDENRPSGGSTAEGLGWPGQTANESYRAGLSQKLRRPNEDEALPTSEQLNLFAKLYFHRFHPLLPIIHATSFRPTAENSLLFLSLCSLGSLFVGSPRAVSQGSRIFERLNKAILASWESFLSQSHPDSLSMVQAAVLGQTYAILSGKPKYLVLADVLHGTVVAWARESNRIGARCGQSHDILDGNDIEKSWHRWIDSEQRARVQAALNIHDAELAALSHHQPNHSHRIRQFPRLASDDLFAAPTSSKWAVLFRRSLQFQNENQTHTPVSQSSDPFPATFHGSQLTAYGILEGISARLIDAKQTHEFDCRVCQDTSDLLIRWWQTYNTTEQDPFCLPVLWHSIFISLYADIDLLEQSVGRDGRGLALEASPSAHEWACTFNASRCLVHASLITRYLERLNISVEPAIHVPRALFLAALVQLCVAQYAPKHVISAEAFASPEIKLLGDEAAQGVCYPEAHVQNGGAITTDIDQLCRTIDLLQRGGRWGISQAFASVLSTALEEGKVG